MTFNEILFGGITVLFFIGMITGFFIVFFRQTKEAVENERKMVWKIVNIVGGIIAFGIILLAWIAWLL